MTQITNPKKYDLEDRTLNFARAIRTFVNKLPKTLANLEDSKQVLRFSGSIGADYIEANESLSKKDFLMRVMISRKEAKETEYWLELIQTNSSILEKEKFKLMDECIQLKKIFGSIVVKSK